MSGLSALAATTSLDGYTFAGAESDRLVGHKELCVKSFIVVREALHSIVVCIMFNLTISPLERAITVKSVSGRA
jgi:hypothetical protein